MDKESLLSLQERFGIAHDCFRDKSYQRLMGGWNRVVDTEKVSPHYKMSGLYAALYQRETEVRSQYILAFRGYDEPEDLDDMMMIGMDQIPDQVADGYHFARHVIAQHNINPRELECIGHSLGGYLSKAVGLLLQSERIHAFNSPGLDKDSLPMLSQLRRNFIDQAHDVNEEEINKTVVAIISNEDKVAKLGDYFGRIIAVNTTENHHRLPVLEEALIRHCILAEDLKEHPRAVPGQFLSAWKHLRKIMS